MKTTIALALSLLVSAAAQAQIAVTPSYPLPISAGGTGSGTKTFVDTNSTQTITGNKTLSGTTMISGHTTGGSATSSTMVTAPSVVTASAGNSGSCASAKTLITYSLPASALQNVGQGVRVTVWGTTANNATAKTIQVIWGGQTFLSKALAASVAGTWRVSLECYKTGSSTQFCYGEAWNNPGTTVAAADGATVPMQAATLAGTQTDTSAITIGTQCITNANAANDIVAQAQLVEFIN